MHKHFPHCLVCWDVELRQGISGLVFQRTIPLQSGGAVRFDVVVADEKAPSSLREAAGKYGALRVIGELLLAVVCVRSEAESDTRCKHVVEVSGLSGCAGSRRQPR